MTGGLRRRPLILAVLAVAVAALGLIAFARPGSVSAHPLGNFTINRYSRIEVYSDVVRVHYVLDMAEIPTFQENSDVDTNGDGTISDSEAQMFASARAKELSANLDLELNGKRAGLMVRASNATFPEGQGGLSTTRLDVTYETPAPNSSVSLAYVDGNYADRLGWREVIVLPTTGAMLSGDFVSDDVSHALTSYPGDKISSPLDTTSVALAFDASTASHAPAIAEALVEKAPERSGAAFVSLISVDNVSLGAVLLALLAAFAFGALHAVEPGHGKTLVAAYFVGVKGTVRQALGLGLIVAVTHTVGVLAIGLVAIFGSQWILPEKLYPWLSLASGLMVLALGVRLILSRGGGRLLHKLSHLPLLGHHHHDHRHDHGPASASNDGVPPWKTLIGVGLADGLTPSPSALVVLLAAISLHRVGLGLALIVSFSIGLATVLAAISLGLLFFRQAMDGLSRRAATLRLPVVPKLISSLSAEGAAARALPLAGAFALVAVGLVLTLRALGQPGMSL